MLTIFTWGYWGWGNATGELVRAVDATERKRGFAPPVFVDIRVNRSVRAKGFCGRAFETLVTPARYRWMPSLGNQRIADRASGIQIVRPCAAKDLLELALRYKEENRRVLFYCACEFRKRCHRRTVRRLILREASNARQHIEIVEWPGGAPSNRSVSINEDTYTAVQRGRKNIPLGDRVELGEVACLPWGSIITLRGGQETLSILTGPAMYQKGWSLPIWERGDQTSLRSRSSVFRKKYDLEAHRS